MNYTKPEVILAGSALASIQGLPKPDSTAQDNSPKDHTKDATANAYEADE